MANIIQFFLQLIKYVFLISLYVENMLYKLDYFWNYIILKYLVNNIYVLNVIHSQLNSLTIGKFGNICKHKDESASLQS